MNGLTLRLCLLFLLRPIANNNFYDVYVDTKTICFWNLLTENLYFSVSGAKQKTRENLKEMCDVQSGMASAIIQMYLKEV